MLRLTGSDNEHAVLHDLGGHGPPLLLTHGNGLNAGMWATVVPHLADGFHCWGLDFRGHGAARPTHDEFSVDRARFVAEVGAAVDALGGDPIAAVGHSLGGASLLLSEIERPGRFRKIFAYEPVLTPEGFERPHGTHPLVVAARRRRIRFANVQEAFDRLTSKLPFSACEPAAVQAYLQTGSYPTVDGAVRLSCSGNTEARIYETSEWVSFERLAAVKCPVVVARGEQVGTNNEVPPRLAQPIADALGDGRLVSFANLSHFGPMEDGAQVAKSIRQELLG